MARRARFLAGAIFLTAGLLLWSHWDQLWFKRVSYHGFTGRFPIAALYTLEHRLTQFRIVSFQTESGELLRMPENLLRGVGYVKRQDGTLEVNLSTKREEFSFFFERSSGRVLSFYSSVRGRLESPIRR